MADDTGLVVTVDGPIDPEGLGVTLAHEHTFADFAAPYFEEPDSAYERELAYEPVSMDNLWYVDRNHFNHEDNLLLQSLDEAIEEVSHFYRAGGDTIVDVTPKNVGEDPERVRAVARETGVQYVHGTAYYSKSTHPDGLESRTIDDIEAEFVNDVRDGIDDTDIRAGIVGEIGLSGHIHETEERVLRAGARAARRTGAPLTIHPAGRTPDSQRDPETGEERAWPRSRWGLRALDIVEDEGLPAERVVIDHMDGTLYEDLEYQHRIAERGAYLEYDLWGTNKYIERWDDGYPSDTWRVRSVTELVEAGHADRLLFSHDIGSKTKRRTYGGHGYGHVLEVIVPRLRRNGVSQDAVDEILVENPRRLLTFAEPQP